MPELPEIENLRLDLMKLDLIGRRFAASKLYWSKSAAAPSGSALIAALTGRCLIGLNRHGKWLRFDLDRGALWLHLRMSGKLIAGALSQRERPALRVSLNLESRQLHLIDPRKFARLYLLENDHRPTELGPDALLHLTDAAALHQLCRKIQPSRRSIKAALLDQSRLAGIGNIYADEALWLAKVHPAAPCETLLPSQIVELLIRAKEILANAIACGGTSLGNGVVNFRNASNILGSYQHHLSVYGRCGRPCPRCSTPIERVEVAQRSSHFCPDCQRNSLELAR